MLPFVIIDATAAHYPSADYRKCGIYISLDSLSRFTSIYYGAMTATATTTSSVDFSPAHLPPVSSFDSRR